MAEVMTVETQNPTHRDLGLFVELTVLDGKESGPITKRTCAQGPTIQRK